MLKYPALQSDYPTQDCCVHHEKSRINMTRLFDICRFIQEKIVSTRGYTPIPPRISGSRSSQPMVTM